MQKLEKLILETRAASPIDRIGAEIAQDARSIQFYPLSACEHCGGEIALGAGFAWSEWGWYRADYNRAQQYADATQYAHHAQYDCALLTGN